MAITRSAARTHESEPVPKRSRSPLLIYVNDVSSDSESEHETTNQQSSNTSSDNVSIDAGGEFTLSDPDVLDCPICTDPLTIPVFQCEFGHFSCFSCRTKINDKCPSCRKPIGYKRCLGMENVLESIKTSCKNFEHGCLERMSYCKKLEHENYCEYTPVPCPCVGCEYVGVANSFYDHYVVNHPRSCKLITLGTVNSIDVGEGLYLLFEKKDKTLFSLQRVVDPLGSYVCVSTAATASNVKFRCELMAESGGRSINMKSFVEIAPKCFETQAKEKCLLITQNIHARACCGNSKIPVQLVIHKVRL